MFKYFFPFSLFLGTSFFVTAQKTYDYEKLKEQYSEKYFYKEIFQNPAFMQDFGKFQISTIALSYKNKINKVHLVQKPSSTKDIKIGIDSYYPFDKIKTVWGNAYYVKREEQEILWNESIDYDLIYPYFTANSIGGNLKTEKYAFLGGYAESFPKTTIGVILDYKAKMSFREKDPRVKNVSSNLKLKTGGKINNVYGLDIGVQVNFQKYTQSNNIKFFNELGNPPIYHLNGLGHFNKIFKGNKTNSFYDGIGYGGAIQLINSKEKDYIFSFDFNNLTIDKLIVENITVEISTLKNKNLQLTFSKIFETPNSKYGIKLLYDYKNKQGIESIFASRSISEYKILSRDKKYNLNTHIYQLNFMYLPKLFKKYVKAKSYVSYKTYREKYNTPKSYQNFDYIEYGINAIYLQPINVSNFLMIEPSFYYRQTLNEQSLIRNDNSEKEIHRMLYNRTVFLGMDDLGVSLKSELTTKINKNYSMNFGVMLGSEIYNKEKNVAIMISTGLKF